MKSKKSVFFRELFFLGLFFSVLFLSFFRNLLSSLAGIEIFIPLFGIPVFLLAVLTAGLILIPRNFKFSRNYHVFSSFTAMLFAVYGLVFLFLSFRMMHRFMFGFFFLPEFFRSSAILAAVFIFACGYTAGIICGIMLKKLKSPEEYEAGFNGFAWGFAAGCSMLPIGLSFFPQWIVLLPSAAGFLFLSCCCFSEEGSRIRSILFFSVSLAVCLASCSFVFFNGKEFFPRSMESFSGKYELGLGGLRFNGRYEPINPEMDKMLLLTAGLQNGGESGKKVLILSPVNMGFVYFSEQMPFADETEILSSSSEMTDLFSLYSSSGKVRKQEEDPFFFLKKEGPRYDLIVLDAAESDTLAMQRFLSFEMFQLIRERLDRGGVFAMRLSSERDEEADRILTSTVAAVFSHVLVTGSKNRFLLASEEKPTLSADFLEERMVRFFAGRKLPVPQNLFAVAGKFLEKDSVVIDGKKINSDDIMTKRNPLLLYSKWKKLPFLKDSGIWEKTYLSFIRHLSVILLISAILYLILRYFMTDRLEKKIFFRSIELGGFTFGTVSFFCILYQIRVGTLYFMAAVLFGMFALGTLAGRKIRELKIGVMLSGLLPFAVYWISPDLMRLTEAVFLAGMFLLGMFFRSGSDSCREICEDVRWTVCFPAAVMLGGTAGVLLVCCILPCFGVFWCMFFLFLTRLPGMFRHS